MLWFPGMDFVVYQADRLTPEQYDVVAHDYQQRLEHLFDESRFPTVVRMADTTTSNKSETRVWANQRIALTSPI